MGDGPWKSKNQYNVTYLATVQTDSDSSFTISNSSLGWMSWVSGGYSLANYQEIIMKTAVDFVDVGIEASWNGLI